MVNDSRWRVKYILPYKIPKRKTRANRRASYIRANDRPRSVWLATAACAQPQAAPLPLFVDDIVGRVYREDIGFVVVMRRLVRVESADAEFPFGRQIVDGHRFARARVAAFVERNRIADVVVGQDAEVVEEGPDFAVAVAVDEVDAQTRTGLAELDGRGGMEDDGVGWRPGVDERLDEAVDGRGRGRGAAAARIAASAGAGRRQRVIRPRGRRRSPPPAMTGRPGRRRREESRGNGVWRRMGPRDRDGGSCNHQRQGRQDHDDEPGALLWVEHVFLQ